MNDFFSSVDYPRNQESYPDLQSITFVSRKKSDGMAKYKNITGCSLYS